MAYNYFSAGFPGYQAGQAQPAQPQSGIIWVQGEAGARAYLTAPSQSVMLLDSEGDVFYIKSTDASGMPMPLRVFDYKERVAQQVQATPSAVMDPKEYVTRSEFEKRIAELTKGAETNE